MTDSGDSDYYSYIEQQLKDAQQESSVLRQRVANLQAERLEAVQEVTNCPGSLVNSA